MKDRKQSKSAVKIYCRYIIEKIEIEIDERWKTEG